MNKESELSKEINEYVEMFNSVCKQIGSHLLSQVPKNRDIHIYNEAVCNLIKDKPNEAISLFVTKVYADDKYRKSILKGDENFFMKHDHDELAGNDPDGSDIITQVKNCWSQLNGESKQFIKEAFKTMINVCEIYIAKKDDLYQFKKNKK
jgi:hypothetical protein